MLLCFCALLTPLAIQASSAFTGFYTGAGIGSSITSAKIRSQLFSSSIDTTDTFAPFSNASLGDQLKKTALFGAVYTGVGFSCARFYLGSELFFKISNRVISIDNTFFSNTGTALVAALPEGATFSDSTQLTFKSLEICVDARPGILLSPCSLLYGRVGVAFNRIGVNSTLESTTFSPDVIGPPIIQDLTESGSQKSGLRFGLGMEQMFSEHFSLRLDYIYTRYKIIRIGSTGLSTITNLAGTFNNTFTDQRRIKPENHSFMLGLTLYW